MKEKCFPGTSGDRRTAAAVMLLLAIVSGLYAIDPPVTGKKHGVVASHYLATEAGFKVLENGGNAADAAFAVAAVLGVVEGWFSSPLGGEVWGLFYDAETGGITALDAVGPAGSRATLEFWRKSENNTRAGLHMAVVPGAWDGWMIWLSKFGTKELPELLEPALALARDGFPVSAEMNRWIGNDLKDIQRWPLSKAQFLPGGKIPAVGTVMKYPAMAKTYGALLDAYRGARSEGRDAAFKAASDHYYRGPIAEAITAHSKENGGLFELSDFNGYHARLVEPIHVPYKRGIEVYQCPPNSQGISMLMGLAVLRGYDFSDIPFQSADMIHLMTEAMKLTQADKYRYVGDPAFEDVPVGELLSEEYAAAQRTRIDMKKAVQWPFEGGLEYLGSGEAGESAGNTSTFQIVDEWGNGVSVTTSLGANFYIVGDTGIIINDRMRMYSAEEGNPNAVEPGKRVRHTSNPYMALKDGKLYILGGNTGVDSQPQGQIQQVVYTVEYGRDPQDAVSRSRFVTQAFPASTPPYRASNNLALEGGYGEAVRAELRKRGHKVTSEATWGNANMAVIDPETGLISFGADPRGENRAMAE